MRTISRDPFKMKHLPNVDIVWGDLANSIKGEVFADRLTKVHVAFPLTEERLGTIPPEQTRPWGITQLSIHTFHGDE